MIENLVIVESPAKAKTIEKFLGKGYQVVSSYGHIRDLKKKDLGIDIKNNFEPQYTVPSDKKKAVSELKKLAKQANCVWLASDEDREGEAIAWHLFDELKLKEENTRRIVFNSITKEAVLDAIENPRSINMDLVKAQQARRVLDRLVGFELSPLLWKKVKPSLSAGRVQSVAVRLLVEREREVKDFVDSSAFKVVAHFSVTDVSGNTQKLEATLNKRFSGYEETLQFVERCKQETMLVSDIQVTPGKRSPSAPFTTSTLQQEASRKLGYSVSQTMSLAQRLYESGHITYMRTDSVNLAPSAVAALCNQVEQMAGKDYVKARQYNTKSKGAQEAHEAIRPSYPEKQSAGSSAQEKRLYDLIWKRSIASQMSDARLEKTTITVSVSGVEEKFISRGEVIKFDGFLKVYMESFDDDSKGDSEEAVGLLPELKVGEPVVLKTMEAIERFANHPPRYNEASLVRKLEELGIGRPSTYAPTVSTVVNRGYVEVDTRDGYERKYQAIILKDGVIKEEVRTENTGAEKKKLFPTDIGMVVNDYLEEGFPDIMNYNFTAKVEEKFDSIAAGKMQWQPLIDTFYSKFHSEIEKASEKTERKVGERILGEDPESGKPISVRIGRFGPMVQIGSVDDEEKPRFAGLKKGQQMDSLTLEEALELFKLPRNLGEYEGTSVTIGSGRFGPYVRHDGKFISIKESEDDPLTMDLTRAIELIEAKREEASKMLIKTFEEDSELQILNGRYGPYIKKAKKNYRLPKGIMPEDLSYQEVVEIMEKAPVKTKGRRKK